jgi:hypothetical protein
MCYQIMVYSRFFRGGEDLPESRSIISLTGGFRAKTADQDFQIGVIPRRPASRDRPVST